MYMLVVYERKALHIYRYRRFILLVLIAAVFVYGKLGCRPPSRNTGMNVSIHVVPIGNYNPEDIKHLEEELKAKFGNCIVESSINMPEGCYNPQRGQYMAGILLDKLIMSFPDAPSGAKILGVTNEDLYSPGLNFVFGQAQLRGQFSVISLKRLDPTFYGMTANRTLFLHRIVKEAVHELGHTLSFEHCPNKLCVMHFSNSLYDTDVKGDWFCQRCLSKLKR